MASLQSINPATGEVVGEVEITPVARIPELVARARNAQPAWGDLGPRGRADVLAQVADRIIDRSKSLGRLLTMEMGKPVREAVGEIRSCGGDHLRAELDDMVDALAPEVVDDARTRSVVYRDPLGVCAAITPWNFPFAMPHWMVMPALMAGNAVILKPSEETPLIGQAYADLLNEVLPPGVLQVVHGADDQGKALVAADVDLIAFTGSREAGKHILAAASRRLARVVLELGGKDPLIVLRDADVGRAAKFAAQNSFRNAGQVCVSTERIYVDCAVADAFLDKLIAETRRLTVGNGLDEDTQIGPMINARQRDHVVSQVRDAIERGATVAFGGGGDPDGNFLQPTILVGVTHDMAIAVDETFGPVACVTVVDDEDEAVALANDSRFGLGAVVFGEPDHAARVARRLDAGMIGINRGCGGARGTPWVGAKESGYGYHSSRDGHRQFAQTRVVSTSK
ncbi:MAG: aldehyde dehydrogenase [Deltaproteobacteria bacterium]|nr:MAG: aldehyde dehydrogenase [Deltaproteobacteria bacterium]